MVPHGEDNSLEVIGMNRREDSNSSDKQPILPGEGEQGRAATEPAPPRLERKRRKVSLIAAIVINVVTIIVVAIVLLAFLLPGYRRSYTMGRAVKGADEAWIVVKAAEAQMRANKTDFLSAQDSLKNAFQELVGAGGDNVYSYVRDSFPDREWISQNLPTDMQQWLEQLYPHEEAPNPSEAAELETSSGE